MWECLSLFFIPVELIKTAHHVQTLEVFSGQFEEFQFLWGSWNLMTAKQSQLLEWPANSTAKELRSNGLGAPLLKSSQWLFMDLPSPANLWQHLRVFFHLRPAHLSREASLRSVVFKDSYSPQDQRTHTLEKWRAFCTYIYKRFELTWMCILYLLPFETMHKDGDSGLRTWHVGGWLVWQIWLSPLASGVLEANAAFNQILIKDVDLCLHFQRSYLLKWYILWSLIDDEGMKLLPFSIEYLFWDDIDTCMEPPFSWIYVPCGSVHPMRVFCWHFQCFGDGLLRCIFSHFKVSTWHLEDL